MLVLSSACAAEGVTPRVCSSSAAVVYGSLSEDEHSTVSVGGLCTGVLVGPYTVLTAAHCHEAAKYVVHSGRVASVWNRLQHPDWTSGPANDIEVLVLSDPLPGPYAPIGNPHVGSALVQGYGSDENGEAGSLKEGTVTITQISAEHVYTAPGTNSCYGDSGGPIYQDGAVVALTSHGSGGECGSGSINVAPDAHLEWLELVSPDPLTIIDSGC